MSIMFDIGPRGNGKSTRLFTEAEQMRDEGMDVVVLVQSEDMRRYWSPRFPKLTILLTHEHDNGRITDKTKLFIDNIDWLLRGASRTGEIVLVAGEGQVIDHD